MKQNNFEICGLSVPPGTRKRCEVQVAQLFDQTQMTMPLEVVRGKEDGPILLITGAMHGDEINGCEIVKRILTHRDLLSKLKGTLVAVPIINVFGFNRNVRYLPDRRDLNRCFPGDKHGSLGAQIAHTLLQDIALKCTHVIDFHTGAIHRSNFPQVRASLDNGLFQEFAQAFNVPLILNSSLREGSMRKALNEHSIPNIVFEGGEALRYDESVIKVAINGTFSLMTHLGMLEAGAIKMHKLKEKPYIAQSSLWLRAPSSGSLRLTRRLGAHIKEGDLIGVISNPFGRNKSYIRAQHDGVIIGISNLPLVISGDALIHIAVFKNPKEVRREMELLDDEIDIYNF